MTMTSSALAEPVGCGLHNLGNSCFMNAVLQCIVHTPPLNQYMRNKKHSAKCSKNGSNVFCSACRLEALVLKMFQRNAPPFPPRVFADNLSTIARGFRLGRQEDAHEFLRCLLEHLTKGFNPSVGRPPKEAAGGQKHTLVQNWFQGPHPAARGRTH